MIDQSTDTIEVQNNEPKSFIGVIQRNMVEGLGEAMIQRQLNLLSPLNYAEHLMKQRSWSALHSLQAPQQFGQCLFQRSASIGLNLLQAALLVSDSSRHLVWSQILHCRFAYLQPGFIFSIEMKGYYLFWYRWS